MDILMQSYLSGDYWGYDAMGGNVALSSYTTSRRNFLATVTAGGTLAGLRVRQVAHGRGADGRLRARGLRRVARDGQLQPDGRGRWTRRRPRGEGGGLFPVTFVFSTATG